MKYNRKLIMQVANFMRIAYKGKCETNGWEYNHRIALSVAVKAAWFGVKSAGEARMIAMIELPTPTAKTTSKAVAKVAPAKTDGYKRTKCVVIKYKSIKAETEKAILVADFNGNEDWIPESQIYDRGCGRKTDYIVVSAWIASKKSLTVSETVWY